MSRPNQALQRAKHLERITYDAVCALERSVKKAPDGKPLVDTQTAGAMARLVAAWQTCCERVLIAKGKPLTVKPSAEQAKRRPEWYATPPAPSAVNAPASAAHEPSASDAPPPAVPSGRHRAATDATPAPPEPSA